MRAFANITRENNIQVRFIEFMPATPEVWDENRLVKMDVVKKLVETDGELFACKKNQWGGPAEIYKFKDAMGEVGFISAVSHHFCEDCNRLRLTSTGGLMTCLFGEESYDLKSMLFNGSSKEDIKQAIRDAVASKNEVREMEFRPGLKPRKMSCVGG